jgi:hypothetical protein
MPLRRWFPLILLLTLFAGCSRFESELPAPITGSPNSTTLPQGTEMTADHPSTPGKGEEAMIRGEVFIDSLTILSQQSFPRVYQLQVKGSLPTPCHQLRTAVSQPTSENEIFVQVYSLADPRTVCSQALQPFETSVPLGSYVRGSYTVYVNGQNVGEITP